MNCKHLKLLRSFSTKGIVSIFLVLPSTICTSLHDFGQSKYYVFFNKACIKPFQCLKDKKWFLDV